MIPLLPMDRGMKLEEMCPRNPTEVS
uniref:Uncharacterized protein n=1 Tax=Rhizophora mucronata TaxID=61149 RepID=A0A2P2R0F5_RHIMU